ncbi:MAG TPA: HAD-IA family hydrolase [Pseudomonadota bacterium]|nr:HAD-IA family hydrolase [Pseudomonadota bacterium]HQY35946.1 HAD-IA family hydrolase [Pseudomonadota bacterium]HRA36650.1 HAD-IA family hydrolase [Pseudomonadota bacterium]
MIRALTLDLDDTLWPIEPVVLRAEAELDAWLAQHCPEVAAAWPIEAMRALRTRVHADNPELAHDFTALRKLSLAHVFEPFGHGEELVERAFEVFYAARNRVELYPDAGPALQRLAGRFPIASLSNGNADLHRIGLGEYFVATVTARTVGVGKPHPRIFERAVACLGLPAAQVAHVGDDPLLDVQGAQRAGLVAVWLNRSGAAWPLQRPPDIEIAELGALEPALERYAVHGAIAGGIR